MWVCHLRSGFLRLPSILLFWALELHVAPHSQDVSRNSRKKQNLEKYQNSLSHVAYDFFFTNPSLAMPKTSILEAQSTLFHQSRLKNVTTLTISKIPEISRFYPWTIFWQTPIVWFWFNKFTSQRVEWCFFCVEVPQVVLDFFGGGVCPAHKF